MYQGKTLHRKRKLPLDHEKSKSELQNNEINKSNSFKRRRQESNVADENQVEKDTIPANSTDTGNETGDLYFRNALQTLKAGIPDDQIDIFMNNVLEQTIGKEVQLSKSCSHCIEMLLQNTTDISVIVRFMKAFSEEKEEVFGNRFAAHITENLLYIGIRHMTNWVKDVELKDQSEESKGHAENVIHIISWISSLGEFARDNLQTCFFDPFACHVLRSLLQVLGGHYIGDDMNRSKKSKLQKQRFDQQLMGDEFTAKKKEAVTLHEVPKFFISILKDIAKSFLNQSSSIKDFVLEARTASVIHSLLFVLKKRVPKWSKVLVEKMSNVLFEDLDYLGIPFAMLHKSSSYVIEKLFEGALPDQQCMLWDTHFKGRLTCLIEHPVANFVIQRILDIVTDNTLFEQIHKELCDNIETILSSGHQGILVSMASACNRLNIQQAQFIMATTKALKCSEPEDRQLNLVPLVLGFVKYDNYIEQKKCDLSFFPITLQGSLVLQALLKFKKPIKIVKSFLNVKSEDLHFMACHTQGCHALTQFFACVHVGEKNKDKLLENLKSMLVQLASDRNGSLTLSRLWVLLSLKQKKYIAEELLQRLNELKKYKDAMILARKFGIFNFKHNPEEWCRFQETLTKRVK